MEQKAVEMEHRLQNPCKDTVTGDILTILDMVKNKGNIALQHATNAITIYVSKACASS